ncbi:MAG: LPXTG cell wall anchor domain-containing protein [Clostridiales bacterium]|nr:LPXTG cell wall anchor domain-containing protein [Clostridiales bacterium]
MTKNFKTKLTVLIMVVSMCLAFIPTTTFATESTTNGTTINGQLNISSLSDDASSDGWSWVESTKTLTLTNLTIVNDDNNYKSGIILPDISNEETATIVLVGDNYISGFNQTYGRAFATVSDVNGNVRGNLTITGTGSLTISDGGYIQNGSFLNVTIDGATLTSNTSDGWMVSEVFTVKNGATVNITVTETSANAVYALQGIEIIDSTMNVSLTNSTQTGLCGFNTTKTNTDVSVVIENSTVTITGENTSSAIYCRSYYGDASLSIVNSTVTIGENSSWGIYCYAATGTGSADTYIEDSTINIDSTAGVYSNSSLTLAGDVNILTDSNRQVLCSPSLVTDDLGDNASIQGYSRQGDDIFYLTDYTLTTDFEVTTGRTLTIPEGVTLTLDGNTNLTSVDDEAITNNGTIVVSCSSAGGVKESALNSASIGTIETSHTEGESVIENEVEATCTEDGSYDIVVYCKECEEELSRETVTVSATGHTWDEGVVTTQATETTDGVKTYTCTVCGATKTEVIPATGETTTQSDETTTATQTESTTADESTTDETTATTQADDETTTTAVAETTTSADDTTTTTTTTASNSSLTSPNTGNDNSLFILAMFVCASGLILVLTFSRKQKSKQ